MLDLDFTLDGISAKSAHIILQAPIKITGAEPVVETIHIPGRNGDLTRYTGEYKNRKGSAKCWCYWRGQISSMSTARMASYFLLGKKGYRKLEIKGDDDHYWMARIVNGAEVDDRLNTVNVFNVNFDIMPQWWKSVGDTEVNISAISDHTYTNGTKNDAKPICYLRKPVASSTDSPTTFGINGNSVLFNYPKNRTVVIVDCEKQIVTDGGGRPIPCQFYQFPFLKPGVNQFSYPFSAFTVSMKSKEYDL